jgi:ribosomal protein L37AE/L43A
LKSFNCPMCGSYRVKEKIDMNECYSCGYKWRHEKIQTMDNKRYTEREEMLRRLNGNR